MTSRITTGTCAFQFHGAGGALVVTLLLTATGAHAAIADKETTTFWKRLEEKGIHEWQVTVRHHADEE